MMITQYGHASACAAKPFSLSFYNEQPMAMEDLTVETHIVLLPVEPYLVHIYWDIRATDIRRVQDQNKGELPVRSVLRIHDVSPPVSGSARQVIEVDIDLRAGKCYVPLSHPNGIYRAELGFVVKQGRFFSLGCSNVVRTPRAWPEKSAVADKTAIKNRPFPTLATSSKDRRHSQKNSGGPVQKFHIAHIESDDISAMNEATFKTGFFSGQFSSDRGKNISNDD